jgi:hypothetical protein
MDLYYCVIRYETWYATGASPSLAGAFYQTVPGDYIVAFENGVCRSLNETEEAEYQRLLELPIK